MLETHAATVALVADEGGRGAQIRARREQMGWSVRALAKRAHMSRATLTKAEDDNPGTRDTTYSQAERALDELAVELGFEESGAGIVRFEVPNAYGGLGLTVQGPVENLDEIAAAVAKIMRRVQQESDFGEDA